MFRNNKKKTDGQNPSANLPASKAVAPARSLLARFVANTRGAVAIEFAMIALPFFLLIFSGIEVSLSFAAQQIMANATDDVARQLRTGQLRAADVAGNKLSTLICGKLLMPPRGCPDLFVDLQTYSTFANVPLTLPLTADGDVDHSKFKDAPGGTRTINQLRVFYRWPIVTNILQPRITSADGQGKMLIFSSATWRNEPYL
jgi:Flp pilus assembly protein TadG